MYIYFRIVFANAATPSTISTTATSTTYRPLFTSTGANLYRGNNRPVDKTERRCGFIQYSNSLTMAKYHTNVNSMGNNMFADTSIVSRFHGGSNNVNKFVYLIGSGISNRQDRSKQLMKRNFIAPLIATTCAVSVFLYVFFNIDEIREKQKIATENAIKEQNKTISSAQEEQRRKIEKIKKQQQEAIDRIKNDQNRSK